MSVKKCILDSEKTEELIKYLHFLNPRLQQLGYMYMLDPKISYNQVYIIRVSLRDYTEKVVFRGNYTGAKNWFKGVCEISSLL